MTDFKSADRWPWPESAAHQLIIRAKGQWQTIASIVHEIDRLRARLAKLERELGTADETD